MEQISQELLEKIAVNASFIKDGDVAAFTQQLGREPRGLLAVGARCACGAPAVTVTSPRLPDGSPFPTLFYLTLPWVVKEVSRLESSGKMQEYNDRLAEDEELAISHRKAHESFVARRNLLEDIPEISGTSAGGMPDRVKCLHALVGYSLAVGSGVSLIADDVLQLIGWNTEICRCNQQG